MGRRPRPTARLGGDARGARGEKPGVVRVWLLGGFRVSSGGRTIEEGDWRLKKAAALVKILALSPNHRLHRERAMDLLWPGLGAKAASNNLHHALHVARRALAPGSAAGSRYLRLRGDSLALCPDGRVWVDVEAFEEAARAARRAREPAAYRAALDLYAGDLLPNDLYEDWASERREGLRSLRLSLLVEMAALYERRGEPGPAIEALGRVVGIEPTHEEAHAGLMRLYALGGRRHEALLQYGRLEEALREAGSAGPGAEVARLHEEIAAGTFSRTIPPGGALPRETAGSANNLPTPRTSFVGREREIVEAKRLLAMTRLLTLTGAGGSGKTRLALEIARDLSGTYPGGVWFVELAPLSEPELVQQGVAEALRVREQPGRPLTDTLADSLRDRETLLVLDNCEHLVEAAARLADALLSSCPKLRILATSREPLGVQDETRWPVPPLSVPEAGRSPAEEDPAHYEAVRLFVERARLKLPSFALTRDNAGAVAEVCRRLDGLPLAIELATARVGALAVEQVAERLQDSLGLLSAGPRTAAPRQRTLRATLEWSHALLSEPEKELFGRLSAFAGGFTLEAAEAVCPGGVIREDAVLDLLSSLVDKSLVVAEFTGEGRVRYRMLEPVRQYAHEKLAESGESDPVRRRHAAFFLALAEEAEPELRGSEQEAWLGRLEAEHDNLRAALSWALDLGETEFALRLAGALGEFWHIRGHLSEGRRWLGAALERADTPEEPRVKALARAGYLAWETRDYGRATALGKEALALARELGDTAGEVAALYNLGAAATLEGRLEEASASFGEAAELLRASGDAAGLARTLQGLGQVEVTRHDFGRAVALFEEGLPLARKTGDGLAVALTLGMGALAFLGLGDHRRVKKLCAEAMELSRRLEHRHAVAFILHVLAALAGAQGQPVRAARLWGAAEALCEAIGVEEMLSPVERRHYGPYIAAARELLDEAQWQAAWAEGRAMNMEEALRYASSEEAPDPRSPRIKALTQAGRIAWEQGEFERAVALGEEGLALSREAGDDAGAATSLYNIAIAALFKEEHEKARTMFEETVRLQRESGDEAGLARALQALGMAVMVSGEFDRADSLYEEALALARETGDIVAVETSLLGQALNALARNDYERVRNICAEVLRSSRQLNYRATIAAALNLLASAAGSEGQAVRAARLWGASEALRESLGRPDLSPIERSTFARHIAAARSRLDEASWQAAWAEGRAMTPERAVEYALSEEEPDFPLQSARIKALTKADWIAWEQSDFERSIALSEEGLALARESGDKAGAAANLINLGVAAMLQGDTERATALFEESLPLLRELGDKRGLAHSLLGLGLVAAMQGGYGRARALFEECLKLFREAGDAYGVALALNHLGLLALFQEEYGRAEALYKESLKLSRPSVMGHNTAFSLHISATLAGSQGRPVRAARLWGAAEALREKTGQALSPAELRHYGPYIAAARERLDEAAWEAAWVEGRTMSAEEAVGYALSGQEPPPPPAPAADPAGATAKKLTRREREVVSLVALGLTNRRIAQRLSISLRTVENHVRNVLKKLNLHSREEVAMWVNERRRHETDRI